MMQENRGFDHFGDGSALQEEAVRALLDLTTGVVECEAFSFEEGIKLFNGIITGGQIVYADGKMIEVVPVIDHPGGVFAPGCQDLVVGEGWQGPEAAVEELIQSGPAGQVEGIDRIGGDGAGVSVDDGLCGGTQVLHPELAEEDAGVMVGGRRVPPGVELLLRKIIIIPLRIAQVEEDLLQGGDAQMRDAKGAEGDMVVLDLCRVVDDALGMHGIEDGLHIGNTLPVATHEAFENKIESIISWHGELVYGERPGTGQR